MKLIYFFIALISFEVNAKTIELERFKKYIVPSGKQWVVKSVKPVKCNVCTSDLRIYGGFSVGDSRQLTIYGEAKLSFNSETHGQLTLFSGTKFWLGDIRPSLQVVEI